jgi:hypothetical protein
VKRQVVVYGLWSGEVGAATEFINQRRGPENEGCDWDVLFDGWRLLIARRLSN